MTAATIKDVAKRAGVSTATVSRVLNESGYFDAEFSPQRPPWPPGSPVPQRYDLLALARRDPPAVAMWIGTSRADDISYGSTAAMLAAARPPMSVRAVVLQDAGHRTGPWERLLPSALDWLGASSPGFRPA